VRIIRVRSVYDGFDMDLDSPLRNLWDSENAQAKPRQNAPYMFLCMAMGAAGGTAAVAWLEKDWKSLPYVMVCALSLAVVFFILSRRPTFSVIASFLLVLLLSAISVLKFKYMAFNLHIVDFIFHGTRPDTFLFVVESFPLELAIITAFFLVSTLVLSLLHRRDHVFEGARWKAAGLLPVLGALLWLTLPADRESIDYHNKRNHFASSFFVSLGDIVEIIRSSPLKRRLAALPAGAPFESFKCDQGGSWPDIVLVLNESIIRPSTIPGWKSPAGIDDGFRSFDGKVHSLRVETYAGSTWVSELQALSGLSMADLGWRRSYATLFLQDRIQHSLPQHLRDCGYKSVAISPMSFNFLNEGPVRMSIGFDVVLDQEAINASSRHERDAVYLQAALDVLDEHRRKSSKPLFLFVLTMAAHSPYDFRFGARDGTSETFLGNQPEVDEYLNRLMRSRQDYFDFLEKLGRNATDAGIVVAEFGDHHPWLTLSPLIEAEGADLLSDLGSAAYETYYSIRLQNRFPATALPDFPVLDLTYLGLGILEVAGLPLGPVFGAQRELRDICAGAFHTCINRPHVDRYLKRLVETELFLPP
jgi:hypothetical protein